MCLCVLVGLVVGLIVLHAGLESADSGSNSGGGTNVAYDTVKSVKALFRAPETGTMVLNLCVATVVLIGMCGVIVYTALGLVALPIISCVRLGWRGMRHGWINAEAKREERADLDEAARWRERVRLEKIAEVEQQRALNTRQRRHLYSKYGVTSRLGRMPKGAKKRSAELEARQVVLSRRLERLQEDLIVHAVGLEYGVDSSPTRLVHCWFESVRRLKGIY